MVQKYLSKISGPLLDRIDLHVEVTPVNFNELASERLAEKSELIRERVIKARDIQQERFGNRPDLHANAQMSPQMVRNLCKITEAEQNLLKRAMEKLGLSARAYDRILKSCPPPSLVEVCNFVLNVFSFQLICHPSPYCI
jgi:magnesium chelatase family protein